MAAWLRRLKDAISTGSEASAETRELLTLAHRTRARVELIERTGNADNTTMACTIEQVNDADICVSQPTVGGFSRQLIGRVPLTISFSVNGARFSGETRSLARARMRSGGDRPLFGYRLAMPDGLAQQGDRRSLVRVVVGYDLAPRAEIHLLTDGMHCVNGRVHELSEGGVLITTAQSVTPLEIGQHVACELALPEPIGVMTIGAEVRHLNQRPNGTAIGLMFLGEVPGMRELVRLLEIRRSRRQRRVA